MACLQIRAVEHNQAGDLTQRQRLRLEAERGRVRGALPRQQILL